MKFHTVFAAVLALAGAASANAAVAVYDAFTLTYDETTSFAGPSFSFNGGGGSTGFGWNVPTSVQVASAGLPASESFTLPSFTVTANPGWQLSGAVTGFLGNLVFNEYAGGITSATASGMASVNGVPVGPIGGALTKVVTTPPGPLSGGYYVGNTSVPVGNFNSFSFTGGSLLLTANAGPGSFASILGQNQNELKFGLVATPVPEPETMALMLAGLLTLGSLARRRGRG